MGISAARGRELADVAVGDVGDGLYLSFLPQVIAVAQVEEVLFVAVLLADGVDDETPAGAEVGEGVNHGFPDGRGVDDGVELLWGVVFGVTGPCCSSSRAKSRWSGSRAKT